MFGIDTPPPSLRMALEYLGRNPAVRLACMDSAQLGLRDRIPDLTIRIQNGVCAFAVDQQQLVVRAPADQVNRPHFPAIPIRLNYQWVADRALQRVRADFPAIARFSEGIGTSLALWSW